MRQIFHVLKLVFILQYSESSFIRIIHLSGHMFMNQLWLNIYLENYSLIRIFSYPDSQHGIGGVRISEGARYAVFNEEIQCRNEQLTEYVVVNMNTDICCKAMNILLNYLLTLFNRMKLTGRAQQPTNILVRWILG